MKFSWENMRIFRSILLAAILYIAWSVIWQLMLSVNLALTTRIPWFVLGAAAACWWATRVVLRADVRALGQSTVNGSLLGFVLLAILLCIASFAFQAAVTELPATSTLAAPADVSPAFAAAFSIMAPVFAGMIEEVAFRGIIQPSLIRYFGRVRAIGATSLLFVIWHFWNPLFAYQCGAYLVMSVVLGFLAVVSRSLVLCVFAHAAVNMLLNVYVHAVGSSPALFSEKWLFVSGSAMFLLSAAVVIAGRRLWLRAENARDIPP